MSKMAAHILLVEDEENFGMVLKNYLELHDYSVRWCKNGKEGHTAFLNDRFDLCILDVMMPEQDGFALAGDIRKTGTDVPILFLTARSRKEDMIRGYQSGGDDYLVKPFDAEVLLHKLQAILMRKGRDKGKEDATYAFGDCRFHASSRMLDVRGESRQLSPKETQLLALLCANLNEVLTREEALNTIWKDDSYFSARSMDVYIAKLRKYLKPDEKVSIVNVHGDGFRLVADNPHGT
ncbi:MAG: response regulator transcription factor [Flavobacteriales bacterium]|nr:response regulator transcription factor [Flavobacteriales bacterium]MCB9449329.1 response regulator transcription factor [Flavobacteriales bacterium]